MLSWAMRPSATMACRFGQRCDAPAKRNPAGRDFVRGRLVLGRHAAHGVGDHAVDERQAVVGSRRVRAAGEAELEQRPVEQFAGKIAGEGAAVRLAPLSPGARPTISSARRCFAERGHRAVVPGRLASDCASRKATSRGQSAHERCGSAPRLETAELLSRTVLHRRVASDLFGRSSLSWNQARAAGRGSAAAERGSRGHGRAAVPDRGRSAARDRPDRRTGRPAGAARRQPSAAVSAASRRR